jgi:hypothetical protein
VPNTDPNAKIMWEAIGVLVGNAGQTTLQDYLDETRLLLHDKLVAADQQGQLYTTPDLIRWINRAIMQRDLDLAIHRILVQFTLTANQALYPIESITSSGTVMMGDPAFNVIDVLSIIIIPIGGPPGGVRYPLARWAYSRMAYLKTTAYPTYPVTYTLYGAENIVITPVPAINYPAEFDFICSTPPLLDPIDADPLPYPYTDPVPFLAASFAKIFDQRFDEAREFSNPDPRSPGLYQQRLRMVAAGSRRLAVQNPWADLPRNMR